MKKGTDEDLFCELLYAPSKLRDERFIFPLQVRLEGIPRSTNDPETDSLTEAFPTLLLSAGFLLCCRRTNCID